MSAPLLRVPAALAQPRLLGGISTRHGFPSAVGEDGEDTREEGRHRLARALGRDIEDLAWLKQIHGASVLEVSSPGFQGEADALVSASPRWVLLVSVADCCPVLVWSSKATLYAAAHAGWRGCVAGVVPATLEALFALGAVPGELRAWLGPCIGARRFEVGEEVSAQFAAEHVVAGGSSKPHVDLRAALHRQLRDGGLEDRHILSTPDCTFDRQELYWSYRRDGAIAGRHLAYLAPGR